MASNTPDSPRGVSIRLRIVRGSFSRPGAGRDRPRSVMTSTAGEAAADQFARSRIPSRVKARHARRAALVDDAQATGAAHSAFEAQCHREALRKGINAGAVER